MKTDTAIRYKYGPLWNSSMSKKMWELYLRDGITDKEEYARPNISERFWRFTTCVYWKLVSLIPL